MKIIGIDPGTAITGFGIIDVEDEEKELIDAGVIRTPANTPLSERIHTIYDELTDLIEGHEPKLAAVEKLYFAQNVTTAMSVSHARGVVLLALEKASIEMHEYTPLQIKQTMTGYGHAEKHQIQEMVRMELNLQEVPKPDDCADALAVALCLSFQIR